MYTLCLMDPEFDRFDLAAWRIGGYGGAPMPEAVIAELGRRAPALTLINAYGATETTSPATLMPLGQTATHADSVGRVVPCGEIVVVDESGREVPAGRSGEIWIKGPMVVPGYWNNPEATASSFVGGFWKSGDVGSMDAEGY
jgi:long-chain acyl-CoA synthetase